MGRKLLFTEYHAGTTAKIILCKDGVFYNGDLQPDATWVFADDNKILVINWSIFDEHVYQLIDEQTMLYDLQTRQGRVIPNKCNKSRSLLIQHPTWDVRIVSKLGKMPDADYPFGGMK